MPKGRKKAQPKVEQPEVVDSTKESKPEYNLATVFDGARSVRQYDLETHGEAFEKLAQEFASNRGYRVEMGMLKGKTVCPACGHHFDL